MLGRTKESRTYTEDDLMDAAVIWLRKGEIPPEIGTSEKNVDGAGHDSLKLISSKDLEVHNAKIERLHTEVVYETPKTSVRKRFATGTVSLLTSVK